jgi:hypothetical protein
LIIFLVRLKTLRWLILCLLLEVLPNNIFVNDEILITIINTNTKF